MFGWDNKRIEDTNYSITELSGACSAINDIVNRNSVDLIKIKDKMIELGLDSHCNGLLTFRIIDSELIIELQI